MFAAKKFDRHVTLMNRMADALDVDLNAEIQSGRMSPEGYREAAFRCMGCSADVACEKLLDRSDGYLDAPPNYCRNAEELVRRMLAY